MNFLKNNNFGNSSLLDSEEWREILINAASHHVWAIDNNYCFLFGNTLFLDYFKQLTGVCLRAGECVFVESAPDKLNEEWRAYYDRVFLDGKKYSIVVTTHQPQQTIRFTTIPIFSKENAITRVLVIGNDITNIDKQSKSLQDSEMKFRALIEQAAEMLFLHDMHGKIIEVNRATIRETGYTFDELLKMTVFDIDPDAASRLDPNNIWETLGKLDEKTFEVRHRRKDGTFYPAEVTVGRISFGENDYILAQAHNITTRKRAEEELKKSEVHLRAIMESTQDAMLLIDKNGTLIDSNEAYAKNLGRNREELLGKNIFKILPANIAKKRQAWVNKAIACGKVVYGKDYSNGKWSEHTICPIVINEEPTDKVAIFSRDITEKIITEQAIKDSEIKYRTLFESLSQGIIYQGVDGQITEANDAALKILGLSRSQLIGKNSYDKYWKLINEDYQTLPPDEHPSVLALKTGLPVYNKTIGVYLPTLDTYNWVIVNAMPLTRPGEKYPEQVFVSMQNITSRKLAEEALKESEERLRELNATKDKFFSVIAHDLKSPFHSIIGFSEILKHEAVNLEIKEVESYASIIYESANQTLKLLENLLDWARMQQGTITFNPKPLVICDALNNSLILVGDQARKKNINLVNQVPAKLIVNGDENMLKTVFRNLLTNAIKFTTAGGSVYITAENTDTEVRISVTDTGIGISKENINKLFNIGSNFTMHGTEKEKGTGLGLLICKEFIEKHGGIIRVESKEGIGSTFSISLPVKS
ncbi:MAG: PAS domain S-box protein [Bacteroidales bacterium]|nr:PAS domain S-box protein [Bacteroidales bacterium]